jgi:hypothetical protein
MIFGRRWQGFFATIWQGIRQVQGTPPSAVASRASRPADFALLIDGKLVLPAPYKTTRFWPGARSRNELGGPW